MTSRDHLVILLQQMYSFHRDVLPLLDSLHHLADDERVRRALQTQHDGVRGEMETVEQALNLLGVRFKLEHSTLAGSLKEASDRFRRQQSPTRDQLAVHMLLTALAAAGIARSQYQVAVEMAQAIGEGDVARLLEEMDHREVVGQADLGELAPQLLQEITLREIRRAA